MNRLMSTSIQCKAAVVIRTMDATAGPTETESKEGRPTLHDTHARDSLGMSHASEHSHVTQDSNMVTSQPGSYPQPGSPTTRPSLQTLA